ncbi:tetratricopeptide repeat-containing sulfotransferase family protein [Baaleninema simplex]|uniref:tetratricopeptide repeat-containing sulfotransferase family protein n=1 Tax=Baaleninema simplex TaxID=2862350 RepID=UPI00034CECA3|nr:tetratricopeptide repeat-containing sulfotransferase family protein [Baaleninema simplex]
MLTQPLSPLKRFIERQFRWQDVTRSGRGSLSRLKAKWQTRLARWRCRLVPKSQRDRAYLELARSARDRQNWPEAETAYRLAIACNPKQAEAYHGLGDVLQQQGRTDAAATAYRQAIDLDPNFPWSHNNLGDLLRDAGNWKDAEAAYRKAARLNPDPSSCISWENLGQMCQQQQHWEDAVAAYREAIARNSQDVAFSSRCNLAAALRQLGRDEEAAEVYLDTIAIDPAYPWSYHFYFWKTLKQAEKLEAAVQAYRHAIDRAPDDLNVNVYLNLGEALTRQDKVAESLPYYRTATQRYLTKIAPSFLEDYGDRATVRGPDFIVLGAQKAGTSSLYYYMTKHPQILPTIKKEVEFWSWKFNRGLDWYLAHFPPTPDDGSILTGEACPGYLDFREAAERLREVFPDMKAIVLLRNPVDRAISHYHHWVRRNQESRDLPTAIERKIADLEQKGHPWNQHGNYVARGIYVEFLRHWQRILSRERLLVLESEAFYTDPSSTLERVDAFLGLPHHQLQNYKKYNSGSYSPADREVRQRLQEYYRPYNQQLEDEFDLSFSWTRL